MKGVEKVLPSFKEFMKNPVGLVALFALLAVGYLYIDNKLILTEQVKDLREEVNILKVDYNDLLDKYLAVIEKLGK